MSGGVGFDQIVVVLVSLFAFAYISFSPTNEDAWPALKDGQLGKYAKASVATDHEMCSEIGRNVLIRGGNAVDAAIAAMVCLGVVHPMSSGLGGGHFMTIYNRTTGLCNAVDARETAPAAATPDMFPDHEDDKQRPSRFGWRGIAVPGELHGLYTEYKRFGGGLPWAELIQPSIDIMEMGVPVSWASDFYFKIESKMIKRDKELTAAFIDPSTGEVYKQGEIMRTRRNFQKLLRTLADSADPIHSFYKGELVEQFLADLNATKEAILTREDFANYKSIVRDPSEVIYTDLPDNLRMCGPPPPSSSAVTQSLIKTLSGFKFEEGTTEQTVDGLHKFLEASKFAYAHRSEMSDMAFSNTSLNLAKKITSEAYVKSIRDRITHRAQPRANYGGQFAYVKDKGTTNLAVVDQWGNAVVVTTTVNNSFGSKVASPSTGLIWNSQMDDFSHSYANTYDLPPSPSNFVQPGKRPMSSISPIVVFNATDRQVRLVVGCAGGSTIISAVAMTAMRTLFMGWNVKEALDRPRLHNQLIPNVTDYDAGLPQEYVRLLTERGHSLQEKEFETHATAIHIKDGLITANSDYRKGFQSQPAGF